MSDGSIGGYALGTSMKKQLLANEGLQIVGDKMYGFAGRRVTSSDLLSETLLPSPDRVNVQEI
jgi:hypothetical protein